jgi:hypothetical protein
LPIIFGVTALNMRNCGNEFYLRRDEINLRRDYPKPDENRCKNLELDWGSPMEIEGHSVLELTSRRHGLNGSTQSKHPAE